MASATLNYGFPYPEASDNVNIPSDFANLAIDIDSELYLISGSVQGMAPLAGATFTGNIYGVSASFSGNVSSIEPSISSHLATKNYVDNTVVSANVLDAKYIGTDYTLDLTDAGGIIALTSSSAIAITIPLEASVNFDVGTVIQIVNTQTAIATISTSATFTTNKAGNQLDTQYTSVTLYKVGSDSWIGIFSSNLATAGGDALVTTFLLMGA